MSAQERLQNYFEILSSKKYAGYLECKKIMIELDSDSNEKALWIAHDRALTSNMHSEEKTIKNSKKTLSLFDLKRKLAAQIFESCSFCEHRCQVNRAKGEKGICKVLDSKIATEFIHWGEEPELIPSYTIFFSSCTFHCVFCQNWDISQYPDAGVLIETEKLAKVIDSRITKREARNLNLVGGEPTPNLKYILEVLKFCNVNIPIVWNSNMYMSEETMKILDGIVDVYLSDFKYGNDTCAKCLSKIDNYFAVASRNHKIANKQCELIIRHLVMPNHINCCTKPILDWIADNLNLAKVRVNVMAQYRPEYMAYEYEDINRSLTMKEFEEAWNYAYKLGLDMVER